MAFNVTIPPIENFVDMVNLLSSLPTLQDRLKDLETIQQRTRTLLGDLHEVEYVKSQKAEAVTLRQESQNVLDLAKAEAAQIVAAANKETTTLQTRLNNEQAEYLKREKALSARETAMETLEKRHAGMAIELAAQMKAAESMAFDSRKAMEAAQRTAARYNERVKQTQALWDSPIK